MKFVVVAGSQRPGSQSLKVASFVARLLEHKDAYNQAVVLDLGALRLPRFEGDEEGDWPSMQIELAEASGVVLVTPEWAGMASPALKNLLFLATSGELSDKPALLIGVSSGLGGTYPIAELRMAAGKNTHVCMMPDHLIVRGVESVLNGEAPQSDADSRLRERTEHCANVLVEYAKAFVTLRAQLAPHRERFPYGM